jgi:hypothetical protein
VLNLGPKVGMPIVQLDIPRTPSAASFRSVSR